MEGGFVTYWLKKYSEQRKTCNIINAGNVYHFETKKLTLQDMGIAFLIVLAGTSISVISVIIEKTFIFVKQSKRKNV